MSLDTKHRYGKEYVLGTGHGRTLSSHKPANERSSIASVRRTPGDREEVWPFREVFEAWRHRETGAPRRKSRRGCRARSRPAGPCPCGPGALERGIEQWEQSHVLRRKEYEIQVKEEQGPANREVVVIGGGVAGFRGALTPVRTRRSVLVAAGEPRAGGAVEDGVVG